MLLRRITDFILQSRLQALAVAFLLAFVPVIGSISVLIAALVTLRKGLFEGGLVVIAATIPTFISYFAFPVSVDQMQMAWIMLWILVASNVLTWLFSESLRQYSNWSLTLELAALLGIVIIVMIHILNPDIQSWWAAKLSDYFVKTADKVNQLNLEKRTLSPQVQLQMVNGIKPIATGLVLVSVMFNALTQVVLARWWQAAVFNPGGLRKELHKIRLSHVTGVILFVVLLLAYWGNQIALDITPLLCSVFFVAGLSLLHDAAASTKNNWLWLVVMYAGIIWLFPMSFLVVSGFAWLDTITDIRKRLRFKF